MSEKIQSEKSLSNLEKRNWSILGICAGFLPPRVQLNITRNNEEAAYHMSNSSRNAQKIFSLYAPISLGLKIFGVDVDPTPFELLTVASGISLVDCALRETISGLRHYIQSPFNREYEVWGEPFLSMRDARRHPEWYSRYNGEE